MTEQTFIRFTIGAGLAGFAALMFYSSVVLYGIFTRF